MTRNLKALGLALVAVFAMSALAAQGASAANHDFHSDGPATITTGSNTNTHEFAVGTAGTVKCAKVDVRGTNTGALVSAGTYASDTITISPMYDECTFGGNAATVNFEHCDYVFYSDTTSGNSTGGEHANVEVNCAEGNSVKIATSVCTITVGTQLIKDAIRYENDTSTSINTIATAHGVVVGNLNDKAGCALMPKGAVGKYIGTTTSTCFRDDGSPIADATTRTTPTLHTTTEGPATECKVS